MDFDELDGLRAPKVVAALATAAMKMELDSAKYTRWAPIGQVRSSIGFFKDIAKVCAENPKAVVRTTG